MSRDQILGRIRQSLAVRQNDETRLAVVDHRLSASPSGYIPLRARKEGDAITALFSEMVTYAAATLAHVESTHEVPEAVAAYLREHNLPGKIRKGDDKVLKSMPWKEVPALTIEHGTTDGSDLVGVSQALAGVAETGTVLVMSGKDNPSLLNFLPEHHIVVVKAESITANFEAAWQMVRKKYGKGLLPRTVNMITGPSRSADIEQTLLMGAHGPKALHVIIVGASAAASAES